MQFDKSFVAIRSRGTLELFDLGLHVIRDYWWQLLTLLDVARPGFTQEEALSNAPRRAMDQFQIPKVLE